MTALDATAPWSEIAGHYEKEHPKSCEKLVNMSAEQIRARKERDDALKHIGALKKKNAPRPGLAPLKRKDPA